MENIFFSTLVHLRLMHLLFLICQTSVLSNSGLSGSVSLNVSNTTMNHLTVRPEIKDRIIGGSNVAAGKYGFIVQANGCGASLIAPDAILTAAHCYEFRFLYFTIRKCGRIERLDRSCWLEVFIYFKKIDCLFPSLLKFWYFKITERRKNNYFD